MSHFGRPYPTPTQPYRSVPDPAFQCAHVFTVGESSSKRRQKETEPAAFRDCAGLADVGILASIPMQQYAGGRGRLILRTDSHPARRRSHHYSVGLGGCCSISSPASKLSQGESLWPYRRARLPEQDAGPERTDPRPTVVVRTLFQKAKPSPRP
jgi:hypothetical protein